MRYRGILLLTYGAVPNSPFRVEFPPHTLPRAGATLIIASRVTEGDDLGTQRLENRRNEEAERWHESGWP
jgi:hypothetical protein